jgi:hypothetical protein
MIWIRTCVEKAVFHRKRPTRDSTAAMEGHDAAPSSGGLTALSHRLMSKFPFSSQ